MKTVDIILNELLENLKEDYNFVAKNFRHEIKANPKLGKLWQDHIFAECEKSGEALFEVLMKNINLLLPASFAVEVTVSARNDYMALHSPK